MAEPCSCEEAMALRAEIETLRRGEGCHHPSCCRAVEKERDQLRELARELRRELVAWISTPIPLADYLAQTEDRRLALLARAKALGVEVGR